MIISVTVILFTANVVYAAKEPPKITLENQGTISGMYITRFRTKRIAAYLGIPYAQPPISYRRFAPPEYNDLPTWSNVMNATEYAPDCMQTHIDVNSSDAIIYPIMKHDELFENLLRSQMEETRVKNYSEDCLYLNVYVPDDPKVEGYPVVVWIHGGDFVRGSPNDINPFQFVLKQKVIFVTIAYRLSIFGFFSTLDNEVPGNFGLMDQVAALQWIQINIENFGGNKENVCIFGHDAGAVSVGIHLLAAPSAGLFSKAIAMSGNILSPRAVNVARKEVKTVQNVAEAFSCFRRPTYKLLDCLRNVASSQVMLEIGEPLSDWKPIVDNSFSNVSSSFLPDLPINLFSSDIFVKVPLLVGYTNMEIALMLNKDISQGTLDFMLKEDVFMDYTIENGSCFNNQHYIHDAVSFFYKIIPQTTNETIIRNKLIDFYAEKNYGAPAYQLAKFMSPSSPVYLYRFDLKPFSDIANKDIDSWVGVPHNFDLIYTFGLPHLAKPVDINKWDYRDKSISEIIMKMWGNFAWHTNPTNSGVIIDWEAFDKENLGFFIIDRQNFTMSTPSTINYNAFEFWTEFYPKVIEIGTKCCKETHEDSGTNTIYSSKYEYLLCLLLYLTL